MQHRHGVAGEQRRFLEPVDVGVVVAGERAQPGGEGAQRGAVHDQTVLQRALVGDALQRKVVGDRAQLRGADLLALHVVQRARGRARDRLDLFAHEAARQRGGQGAQVVDGTVELAHACVLRGDAGAVAAAGDERATYNVAFDALKAGKYDESARLFQGFLEQYPDGVYTPNALYWLGESYYATRNFQLAEAQFRDLVARYPTHDKAAGGLLKLGLSQFGQGDAAKAEQTLEQVATRFPGSDAARTAQDRLQSIRLGQQIR
ncbi:MAG TPA: tol-pal system protein YbgF [Stenotrophomonas sp.]|nr:tol-pal system protein YbgF [Stenotrophomonas sp.]